MGCIINSCCVNSEEKLDENLNMTWENTKPFIVPLNSGFVIKVYDGDTITIASKLPLHNCNDIFRFSVRLNAIDAPEIRSKNKDEREVALEAKNILSNKILHKYVELKNIKTEKYGRLLADIYLNNENINMWLVKNRYAVLYDGGKKITPKSWKKYKISGKFN